MKGGSKADNIYYRFMIIVSIGYACVFLYDYVLLNIFSIMKEQNCPCQENHRKQLVQFTYPKIIVNLCLYFFILFLSKSKITDLLKKIKKEKKKS